MDIKLSCKTCNLPFLEFENYETHMSSVEHAKATLRNASIVSRPVQVPSSNDFSVDHSGTFLCNVCDIFVTGHIPFQQHMKGQKHLKKLKNREYLKMFSESVSENSKLSLSKQDSDNLDGTVAIASSEKSLEKSCDKFDISSSNHDSSLSISVNLSSTPLQNSQRSSTLSFHTPIPPSAAYPYCCEPCGKSFTGVEPYEQHMDSAQHYKITNRPALGNMPGTFYCDVCAVSLSGPVPYAQHMDSPKHAKQVMKKKALSELCYPDIRITVEKNNMEDPRDKLWRNLQMMSTSSSHSENSIKNDMDVIEADQPFVLRRSRILNDHEEKHDNDSGDSVNTSTLSSDDLNSSEADSSTRSKSADVSDKLDTEESLQENNNLNLLDYREDLLDL